MDNVEDISGWSAAIERESHVDNLTEIDDTDQDIWLLVVAGLSWIYEGAAIVWQSTSRIKLHLYGYNETTFSL